LRKVKEHHRKKRKEARKDGKNQKSMLEKNPGIPNEWPFKSRSSRPSRSIACRRSRSSSSRKRLARRG
jgi:nuclear GTP-binding protein